MHLLFIPLLQHSKPFRSHIEENRFVFPLEPDVEAVNRFAVLHAGRRNQSLAAFLVLDRIQYRIVLVGGSSAKYIRVYACSSMPRAKMTTLICGACTVPSGPGTGPGLMVSKL